MKLSLAVLVAVAVPATAQTPLHRMNCGDGALTLSNGASFVADAPYTGPGTSGWVGGLPFEVITEKDGQYVGGWEDPHQPLHAFARRGFSAYRFSVPNGAVIVRLHLAELELHGPQLRTFDLSLEGGVVLDELDLAAQLGVQHAGIFTTRAVVHDGRLDLTTTPSEDLALLSAIEVWSVPPTLPPPAAVTGLSAFGGFQRNVLTWDHATSPAVAGFRVLRAPSAAGPWTEIASTWTSPPRLHDGDVVAGVGQAYRVAAVDVLGQVGPYSAPVLATPLASESSPLRVFEITISPENQKIIDEKVLTEPKLEVPAVFTCEGQPHDVEVRYRGSSSRLVSKKSWKVKFPAQDPFEGQRDLNLKAFFADESMTREPLTIDLFHAVGHPAADHEPIHLRVNGAHRGVFRGIEQVEQEYLKARDRDPGGSLYECNSNFTPLALPEDYVELYEKKTNASTGLEELIALIDLVAAGPDAAALASVLDVDNYLSYLAVITLVSDVDSVRHNYVLLQDHALQRWEVIAWDNNSAWGRGNDPIEVTLPIDFGTAPAEPHNGLKTAVLALPALRWRLAEKLAALMDMAASLPAAVDEAHDELLFDAPLDVFELGWESAEPFAGAPEELKTFLGLRLQFLAFALPAFQPAEPPTRVWINELLADNEGSSLDEAGEAEDWIELYNASDVELDVGGLHLTDDLGEPTQWSLPGGTLIPAGGHLLLWADGDEGLLHASFKLGKDGEQVALFAADGATLLDVIHFGPQLPDISFGRGQDGGPFFRALALPTPGGPNTTAGNLPPSVTWVEHAPTLVDFADAVTVTAQVKDDDGLAAVLLHVQMDGGGFLGQPMSPEGPHRWRAVLPPAPEGTTVDYFVQAVDGLGASFDDPVQGYVVGALVPGALRVHEIMADNDTTLADEAGDFEDWIEIHNAGPDTADLSGLRLTDDLSDPDEWAFPAGTLLAPGAHLLVWADEESGEGPLHAGIKLSAGGEEVGLFDASGTQLLDGFAFGPQTTDVSLGSLPDGGGVRVELLDASPGSSNEPAAGGHVRYDLGNLASQGMTLAATTPAQLGSTLVYALAGAPRNKSGLLLVGLVPLDVALAPLGTLLAAPQVLLPLHTDAAGQASPALELPALPSLDGLVIYVQAAVKGGGLSPAVASRLQRP